MPGGLELHAEYPTYYMNLGTLSCVFILSCFKCANDDGRVGHVARVREMRMHSQL